MKNEKLFRELGNVDDGLLEQAWQVDDARKLNAHTAKSQKRQLLPRVVAIAACAAMLILVFSVTMPGPAKNGAPNLGQDNIAGSTENPLLPPSFDKVNGLKINSIDKLNYYAAIRIFSGASKLSAGNAGCTLSLLGHGTGVDKTEITEPGVTEGPPVNSNPTNPSDDGTEDIYYHALDPNEPFFVNKVSMFQIQLTNKNGFLASKLGTGLVDVVITEECIWGESLITFRNGEKFFSCLTNGWGINQEAGGWAWNFTTHKYIDGFYIVKNVEQENYRFDIRCDQAGQATAFYCSPFENSGDRPDKDVQIASTTVISTEKGQFTVAELEGYFNSTQPA